MRSVNLTRIPDHKKREAWEKLKREYPDQAAYMRDPFVREMIEHFNAEIIIHLPEKDDAKGN